MSTSEDSKPEKLADDAITEYTGKIEDSKFEKLRNDVMTEHRMKLERIKNGLTHAAENACRKKKRARRVSVITGFLIALIGIILARGCVFTVPVPGTSIPVRELLCYISVFLGMMVIFVNGRYDPVELHKREIVLVDFIYKFACLQEDLKFKLINSTSDEELNKRFAKLREDENALLKDAEKWQEDIRAIREMKEWDD